MPNATRPRSAHAGFTLIELMITLAIVIILAVIGVPSMRNFLVMQQARSDADSLASAIRLARTEAVKRSGNVSICPLPANFNPAQPACVANATGDWGNGWMVFIDYDDTTAGTSAYDNTNGHDKILRVEQTVRSAQAINNANPAFQAITFMANGISSRAAGTFTVGPATNTAGQSLTLTVSRQGRVTQSAWAGTTATTTTTAQP
jgi:type IV fimbrial biogenesis protein FimT